MKKKFNLNAATLEMIEKLAKKNEKRGVSHKDLVETAKAECLAALEKFDEGRGVKQSTYLSYYAVGAMSKLTRVIDRTPDIPIGVQEYLPDTTPDAEEIAMLESELNALLRRYLPEIYCDILRTTVDADDEREATEYLAKKYGKSKEFIRSAFNVAAVKIRNCPKRRYIHSLLQEINALKVGDECRTAVCEACEINY